MLSSFTGYPTRLKTRGSPSACAMRAGGGSGKFILERGAGGSGGILMDVETLAEGMAKRISES